uniref:Uncharacterized protein n=1 Tax=Chromera velia CCMP2878 TaxID=1169474 RepID=A0A0G4GES1_9ALVE|eukprot:Cvel_21557.t1-p1 / transcript=Cvel_21557.t1 / gene=Cvel_21557 / organism=Chromera_velia_CCMP2878 / gene_product=hypothetical protein / transcript_product=hypothetical protein / location=Cvel_scaffold2033:12873-15872(+) / protein_length=162 / sequence_SO=supercontig / SO=protein_coding / is_pseudo=false
MRPPSYTHTVHADQQRFPPQDDSKQTADKGSAPKTVPGPTLSFPASIPKTGETRPEGTNAQADGTCTVTLKYSSLQSHTIEVPVSSQIPCKVASVLQNEEEEETAEKQIEKTPGQKKRYAQTRENERQNKVVKQPQKNTSKPKAGTVSGKGRRGGKGGLTGN